MQTQHTITPQSIAQEYKLDTTSHLKPNHNRVVIRGSYMAMKKIGASKETIIYVLRHLKERIRARDAEPAAWFFGPSRAIWVEGRLDRGEEMTHEELGRALEGCMPRMRSAA